MNKNNFLAIVLTLPILLMGGRLRESIQHLNTSVKRNKWKNCSITH